VNHLGDWGTQFGMLICHLKDAHPDYLTNPPNITDLTYDYKQAKKKFDSDSKFNQESKQTVVALQSGDPSTIQAWKLLCHLSELEFEKIYKKLDVKIEKYPESFYNPMLPDVVSELEAKKLLTVDKGAKCLFLEGK
jgi:arginyl-tRNA synthetase